MTISATPRSQAKSAEIDTRDPTQYTRGAPADRAIAAAVGALAALLRPAPAWARARALRALRGAASPAPRRTRGPSARTRAHADLIVSHLRAAQDLVPQRRISAHFGWRARVTRAALDCALADRRIVAHPPSGRWRETRYGVTPSGGGVTLEGRP